MHIVAITGYYYPYLTPSAGCLKHYLLEIAKDNEVEVVCIPSNSHYTRPLVLEGIKVTYANNLSNKIQSTIKTFQEEKRWPLFTKIAFDAYRALRALKYRFCNKPYRTSIVNEYVDILMRIEAQKHIDEIVSVTFPYHTHMAALRFKEINPSTRWVTFSTDPLAYSESNPIEKWKLEEAKRIEKEVYTKCDYCIVTQELVDNVIDDFNINPSKVMGLPFLLFDKEIRRVDIQHDRPYLLYAGLFFHKVRSPQIMLDIFSRIESADLNLYISGDRQCREILSRSYPSQIKMNGYVSHEKYIQLLGEADVLINLGNKARLQAPHKLMELISTGKPIINFYYYEDTGFDIIEKYPLGINVCNELSIEKMQDIVEGFISDNYKKRLSFEEVRALYPEHLLANQLPKMRSVLLNN